MAEGNGEIPDTSTKSPDHKKLLEYGLDERVASKLDEIYKTGKLAHVDLDERALDALKEFPVDGALNVLAQFLESNLEHVSNKSAYLCGVMKTYRQKSRSSGAQGTGGSQGSGTGGSQGGGVQVKGPDEERIKEILDRTGYTLDVTTGQRKYGGPPPGWDGGCGAPGAGCEVFCGKIPKDMYEDELIPLFEQCGTIWDLRLMMDPMTGTNRGYAFVTFTTRDAAQVAVQKLDNHEIKPGKTLKINVSVPNLRLFVGNIPKSKGKEEIMDEFGKLTVYKIPMLNDFEIRKGKRLGVTISYNNHRLFVGYIPKNRDRDDLLQEFTKHAPGLMEVIIYSSPDDKKKNRGFCFLEYESHKSASLAKRRLGTGRIKVWGCDIIVDWADPQEEPDEQTMSKVKVLYVRNLTQDITEERLKEQFERHGKVERVKKIKDYAFVHFEDRDNAVKAMEDLDGKELGGSNIEVSLAKPPSDKKKKEEILRARERRMFQMLQVRGGMMPAAAIRGPPGQGGGGPGGRQGPGGMRGGGPMGRGDYDYDYDYYGYGDYRGGYSDPYYDENPYYSNTAPSSGSRSEQDYYYEMPQMPPPPPMMMRGGGGGGGGGRRGGAPPQTGGRGRGVVARGRAGGPPGRGGTTRGAAGRGAAGPPHSHQHSTSSNQGQGQGGRGAAGPHRGAAGARGGGRAKASLPGKRKFDGGHQNQGETKRRYNQHQQQLSNSNWGSQPLAQQPLAGSNNGGGEWYQDSSYPQWS